MDVIAKSVTPANVSRRDAKLPNGLRLVDARMWRLGTSLFDFVFLVTRDNAAIHQLNHVGEVIVASTMCAGRGVRGPTRRAQALEYLQVIGLTVAADVGWSADGLSSFFGYFFLLRGTSAAAYWSSVLLSLLLVCLMGFVIFSFYAKASMVNITLLRFLRAYMRCPRAGVADGGSRAATSAAASRIDWDWKQASSVLVIQSEVARAACSACERSAQA